MAGWDQPPQCSGQVPMPGLAPRPLGSPKQVDLLVLAGSQWLKNTCRQGWGILFSDGKSGGAPGENPRPSGPGSSAVAWIQPLPASPPSPSGTGKESPRTMPGVPI